MRRRQLLQHSFVTALVTSLSSHRLHAMSSARAPRIVLRSSWQTVNIGDIAHTPGVLALLEKHLPEAEVRLWAGGLPGEVAEMLTNRFAGLKIAHGVITDSGKASNPELQETIDWSDFLLHGSGPSLVARKDVAAYTRHTRKPFGVYGITFSGFHSPEDRELMSQAEFLFFRDSVSLEKAKQDGVTCPIMDFGPDGAFACDLRNDARAIQYMQNNGLEEGGFVCCIPRLRHTPYWRVKDRAFDPRKNARNEAMAEHDIAPLRKAIVRIAEETELKVMLCPEDSSQMQIGKRWINDKLPADVMDRIVWREDFWWTDEALSTYVRSAGLFGLEMHSPIMCIGNGVPAIVCRFSEQTSKGFMWRDIGLDDWLFDFDSEDDIRRMPDAVLAMLADSQAARARVLKAQAIVKERQESTMAVLARSLK